MKWRAWTVLPIGACCAATAVLVAYVLLSASGAPGLSASVATHLRESGVRHPVTAVLMNFRAYDTMLELAVMVLASLGVMGLQEVRLRRVSLDDRPLLLPLLHVLLPVSVIAAVHMLWIGSFAAGGAFQAGAVLGGAMVLSLLAGRGHRLWRATKALRATLVFGLSVFLIAAVYSMCTTGQLLALPLEQAGTWILCIETAAMLSIAVTLATMFVGGRPVADADQEVPDA